MTTFRTDGGLIVSVAVWNAVVLPLSYWVWKSTGEVVLKYVFLSSLFAGSLALVSLLFSYCFIRVTVDTKRGLVLPLGRVVPWEDVRGTELHEGWIRDTHESYLDDLDVYGRNPLPSSKPPADYLGCLVLLFLPVVALANPLHSRVVIHLTQGRIVLRSFGNPDDLRSAIQCELRSRPPKP